MDVTNNSVRIIYPAATDVRPAIEMLAHIGDKWSVIVISALWQGPLRYNELQRAVTGISQRMLTLTLKNLERDGLIKRTLFPAVPPRVEYELTDLGRTLVVPLHGLYEWVQKHLPAIEAARKIFAEKVT